MKKTIFKFSALAVIALAVFASCDPSTSDVVPVVTVTSPTADTTAVEIGSSVTFKVSLSTDNTLASFQAMSNTSGVTFDTSSKTFTSTSDEVVDVTATVTSEVAAGTVIEITFIGTDSEGLSNNAKKHILVKSLPLTPLATATAFEWKRVGGADGIGLDMFGLTWKSNTATSAVIKKGATKLVELNTAAWTTITTADALKTAIDGVTGIEEWTGVSVSATKTYDLTLGTIKDNVYYLIHVTNGKVETVTAGTQVTITGQYKK